MLNGSFDLHLSYGGAMMVLSAPPTKGPTVFFLVSPALLLIVLLIGQQFGYFHQAQLAVAKLPALPHGYWYAGLGVKALVGL